MSQEENNFENLFKDKFEDFEADVNPSVWKNVQTGLKGAGLGILIKTIMNKLGANAVIAIVSSAATVLSTVVIMNWTGDSAKTGANTKPLTKPIVETAVKPAKVEEIKDFLAADKKETASNIVTIDKKSDAALKENIPTIKTNKNDMESAINALSGKTIASVSASTVGGSVPLIVSFSNNGNGKINTWDFGDGKKETGVNPVHVYDVPGIYTVSLTSTASDGKVSIDNVKIEVTGNSSLLIGNGQASFSPNADGNSDTFTFTSQNIVVLDAVIFDEKKKIVKNIHTEKGVSGVWDGTDIKGRPAKVGVYYYIVNAIGSDGKKYDKNGSISLTR